MKCCYFFYVGLYFVILLHNGNEKEYGVACEVCIDFVFLGW